MLQPPPLETMMARSSTSTPSSTLRRLPPQGSSSACASAFPNSASDYGMLVANGTYALTAGNCVECSCGPANLDLYCTPYELEQRMKHEREEMDSVVMLHRAEMDIKMREERASMREERASMDRALKEEPDKMDSKHHSSTGHAGCLTVQKLAAEQDQKNQEIYNFYKSHA
ncbi:uncharacterized protein [Miscanthus floridulus]|uniref:uncharacterized protein n=1 Tax=Miscanthus floridulus TaxID=154761 RepID=UPI0034597E70